MNSAEELALRIRGTRTGYLAGQVAAEALAAAKAEGAREAVERIRARIPTSGMWGLKELFAILDEEADR